MKPSENAIYAAAKVIDPFYGDNDEVDGSTYTTAMFALEVAYRIDIDTVKRETIDSVLIAIEQLIGVPKEHLEQFREES